MKPLVIRKSNQLIKAVYTAKSAWQMRLLHVAIHRVNNKTTHRTEIRIDAGDMERLLNRAETQNIYRELTRAADDLMSAQIHIKEHHGGGNRRGRRKINLAQECFYLDGEGAVIIRFTDSILPYLKELGKNYKELNLRQTLQMKSTHGIRLYELLLLWEWPPGEVKEVEIEELKQLMGVSGKYDDFRGLRRKVLEPAIADIDRYTDLSLTVGYRKSGRTITHLQFLIERKVTAATEVSAPRTGRKRRLTDDYVAKHALPGESWDQARTRLAASPE